MPTCTSCSLGEIGCLPRPGKCRPKPICMFPLHNKWRVYCVSACSGEIEPGKLKLSSAL